MYALKELSAERKDNLMIYILNLFILIINTIKWPNLVYTLYIYINFGYLANGSNDFDEV